MLLLVQIVFTVVTISRNFISPSVRTEPPGLRYDFLMKHNLDLKEEIVLFNIRYNEKLKMSKE